jgi:hypothetical protein
LGHEQEEGKEQEQEEGREQTGGLEVLSASYLGQELEEGKEQDHEELRYWLLLIWDRSTRKGESRSRRRSGVIFSNLLGTGAERRKRPGAGGMEVLSLTYLGQEHEEGTEQEQR